MLLAAAILAALAAAVVLGHLAVIEIGREVVTLRTPRSDGTWQATRLWIVDDGGVAWLHSAGADWVARFANDPVVEVERGGEARRYRAHAAPGPHPHVDRLLREKYGLADRWVRFLAPDDETTVAVRLDPL
ncbi:MAG: hypothetical protein DCC71_10630 [Proteobacteria bacterium]|nr:MAG: hypothetical protein DCC71_10630 [Pseudomonadota bacterium]